MVADEDVVTPFIIQASEKGVDYHKLVSRIGCQYVTTQHIKDIESLVGQKAHHLLRRGIYFAHRDLDMILNTVKSRKPFYLYTGRGPSTAALHLGHMIPFIINK